MKCYTLADKVYKHIKYKDIPYRGKPPKSGNITNASLMFYIPEELFPKKELKQLLKKYPNLLLSSEVVLSKKSSKKSLFSSRSAIVALDRNLYEPDRKAGDKSNAVLLMPEFTVYVCPPAFTFIQRKDGTLFINSKGTIKQSERTTEYHLSPNIDDFDIL